MNTYLVYDNIYLKHDTGTHPENPTRLVNTIKYLKNSDIWNKIKLIAPRMATQDEVAYVHSPLYIRFAEEVSLKGGGYLDSDTVMSASSYEVALYAVGGVLAVIDEVMEKSGNGFCLVRPPGHHARPSRGMGFCLFNNIAIGAKYIQKKYKLNKIAIIDWDLHHGNGTQEAFYNDSSVLYCSLHKYPYYPGSGSEEETGVDKGVGFTVNIPLGVSTTRDDYFNAFERVIRKIEEFSPDFILISAGFDTYELDPLGGIGLQIEDYYKLTKEVIKIGRKKCSDRIISVLEGGYNVDKLPICIESHIKGLL